MSADPTRLSARRANLRHGALIPMIETLLGMSLAGRGRPVTTRELQSALGPVLGEEPGMALVHEAARTLVRRRRIQSWAGVDGILRYRSLPRAGSDDQG